jgi:hypothetical protein
MLKTVGCFEIQAMRAYMRLGLSLGNDWQKTFFVSTVFFLALGVYLADPSRVGTVGRFLWYCGPGLLTLGLMQVMGGSAAAKTGAVVISAVYFVLFYLWLHSQPNPEALTWFWYLCSYPEVWMAAAVISWRDRRQAETASWEFLRGLMFVFVGLLANVGIMLAIFMS